MNTPSVANTIVIAKPCTHLLDAIRTIKASVGDGLNDFELTRLLQQTAVPTEAGFMFLTYCDRYVTLGVPRQDLVKWYPEKGWIVVEKEEMARTIAIKYGLSLCEPPDTDISQPASQSVAPKHHHHLELSLDREAVIVAHPKYLKVRLFNATAATLCLRGVQTPLTLDPELLQDLSALYQP